MSRPCKLRTVLKEPTSKIFTPQNKKCGEVILKVDEYEVIRLIDFMHCDQTNAAKILNVARTTVQSIYQVAREKIADAIVNSKKLIIEGGDYILNVDSSYNEQSNSYESILKEKERNNMRIALPVENGTIFQHFGHTETFAIYDVLDKEVKSKRLVETNGAGHCALASFLKANEVDLLICGGIGGGAMNALAESNIEVYPGIEGDPEEAIQLYLKEKLAKNETAGCDHHEHECHHEGNHEDHECCHHENGEHKCHCK